MSAILTTHSAGVYLRPGGFLGGVAADDAIAQSKAGRIAAGWAAFSLVEIVERNGDKVDRHWRAYEDIAGSSDQAIKAILNKIEASRAAIAGLAMAKPLIMGIVNVTPDSFSDGGEFLQTEAAIAHGIQLHAQGASILDIGGESTRPGADFVSEQGEADRVVPVLKGLQNLNGVLSVDTRKPAVMGKAVTAGAQIINDVTALSFSPDSLSTAGKLRLPVCLMHAQGTPKTMQDNPQYDDVVLDVYDYLAERILLCEQSGIARAKIVIDPGIGFGKTLRHNLSLIDEIAMFHGLGVPLLLGASRKSFIGAVINDPDASNRLPGSLAAALSGIKAGVQVLRVHDVAQTAQAMQIWSASENSPQF